MMLTVKDGLRRTEDRAALLRYVSDLAAASPERPEPSVLSGIADLAGEIEETVRQVRSSINVAALSADLVPEPTDDDDGSELVPRQHLTPRRGWKGNRRRPAR